ncbi:MAG: uroporphyrinogen decarboxylase [Rhizobiales bacterium]|nr:uroporphyrinogen decarboxylase [Hyphomicrobiales bacterium]
MMKKILQSLNGEVSFPPPIWMMRQAGRYLPEYRATRTSAGSFLDLCYTPEHAIEVTMQPIRRFDFDAAILFSDILVVPDALGQNVAFEEGRGPVLEPVGVAEIDRLSLDGFLDHLNPVFEAVRGIRSALSEDKTLIGFCGAPWTVATYMIAGHGTPDQAPARIFAMTERRSFLKLIDLLVDASVTYLVAQVRAGADCLQIFDTWAGVLSEQDFEDFCVTPVSRIIERVKAEVPGVKIIGFPKGAGIQTVSYIEKTGVDGIGLDWTMPLSFIKSDIQPLACPQGNLDPLLLIGGGNALRDQVQRICETLRGGPHIFNLGHGITPPTPIENVELMIETVRASR